MVQMEPLIVVTPETQGEILDRLRGSGGPPYDGGMEARVAVLEQIAKDTKDALLDIRNDVRELRKEQGSGFRWLLGLGIGATGFLILGYCGIFAVMAHGFKWF